MFAAAYAGFLLTLFAAGLTLTAALFFGRVIHRRPLLEMQPRRPVPWTLMDLLPIGFFLLLNLAAMVLPLVAELSAVKEQPAEQPLTVGQARELMMFDTLLKLLLGGVTIGWIYARHHPLATDWGWSLQRIREDIVIGAGLFLVVYLPTIALQAVLVLLLGWKYDHPLIELTTRTKDPVLFGLAFFVAAIMAPLFEEFVFRGLLQGWLEKAFSRTPTTAPVSVSAAETQLPVGHAVPGTQTIDPNPYASPQPVSETVILPDEQAPPQTPPANWTAIALSSVIFSLMHFSHGPSWIPLLVFGAALGYAYQRTHSLWPGIIAHMLLNGITMAGLWVQVYGDG